LAKDVNVHFSGKYCLACHHDLPLGDGDKRLKYGGDFRRLCRCHFDGGPIHVHPVEFSTEKSSRIRIPEEFPLAQDNATCLTCHDVFAQCRDSEADKILLKGQMLLRGLPYENRLQFCFRCHDRDRYRKYNPHEQVDATGQTIEVKCLYCHSEVPDTDQSTYRDVKLISNYGELCMGCHYRVARQPLHARHLRKPGPEVLARMQEMQEKFDIVLPLDRNGQVTCATCHNPHQKGLIPDRRAGAKGAGAPHRHRLAGNMCIKCHPMR
jgi:hypothetical protein